MTADLIPEELTPEQHRHRCEVRQLMRWRVQRGKAWLKDYLDDPKVAGRRAALDADIKAQWKAGSRGEEGVWL